MNKTREQKGTDEHTAPANYLWKCGLVATEEDGKLALATMTPDAVSNQIRLDPLEAPISYRLRPKDEPQCYLRWQANKSRPLVPRLCERLLEFWSKPIQEQSLYDAYLFGMFVAKHSTKIVLHTDRVYAKEPNTSDLGKSMYESIDDKSMYESIDNQVPIGMNLRITAVQTRDEISAIHLGHGHYLYKHGYVNGYRIASVAELHRMIGVDHLDRCMMTRTIVSEICHSCEQPLPNLRLCARCKSVHYCSQACQRKDWIQQHRQECATMFQMPQTTEQLVRLKELDVQRQQRLEAERKGPPCKTQQELVDRVRGYEQNTSLDLFGVRRSKLILYMDYEHAQPYLKREMTAETWMPHLCFKSSILRDMQEYVEYAWQYIRTAEDEVKQQRASDTPAIRPSAILANRSLDHFAEWMWILGDTSVWDSKIASLPFAHHGSTRLAAICEYYQFPYQHLTTPAE